MIRRLLADHRGRNLVYYLKVDFAQTGCPARGEPDADDWTADDLRRWWDGGEDWLGIPSEVVLDAKVPQAELICRISQDLDRATDDAADSSDA